VKFKLDENLGPSIQKLFLEKGLDCRQIREENLGGAADERVLEAAISEDRILVTMDHDFSNVLLYPPTRTSGIALLNPPGKASRDILRLLVEALLVALDQKAIRGKLWIVELSRIREHEQAEL